MIDGNNDKYDELNAYKYQKQSILHMLIHALLCIFISNIFFNLQGCYDAVKDLISTYGTVFIAISIVVMVVEVQWLFHLFSSDSEISSFK